jgi:hypothetical protein
MIINFNKNDDLRELFDILIDRYSDYLREPLRLREIISSFRDDDITMLVEDEYVDRQYRDSYYNYFSQKYGEYRRNCIRLAFFEGTIEQDDFEDYEFDIQKKFIGIVVLRPLQTGNIGHTLLNPKKLEVDGYFRTCVFTVMVYGRKLKINAFPYSSQDSETMSCAETVLFNLIQYYGEKYSEYRVLMPSEILNYIERESYERVLPSRGLYEENMAKVLSEAHFYPRLYHYNSDFENILYYYIESGIPFVLCIPHHAVICVGHGKANIPSDISSKVEKMSRGGTDFCYLNTSRLINEYIVMDDNKKPYNLTNLNGLTEEYFDNDKDVCLSDIKQKHLSLIIPLYRRIFIDAARAEQIFKTNFLEDKLFVNSLRETYCKPTWGDEENNPFVIRMYLTASRSYKDFKTAHTTNAGLRKYYIGKAFPKFIWVLEISTINSYRDGKAEAEILLDATSSPYSPTNGILSIGYKNHCIFIPDVFGKSYIETDYMSAITDDQYWNSLNDDSMKKKHLTQIYEALYNSVSYFFSDTFEIFKGSNLEGV